MEEKMTQNIEQLAINTIRTLSVDQVQKANSGHPGMPLGAAPIAYSLWAKHMKFSPKDSKWINRDRFVLSAGHASAMYYSLLHLFGYNVSLDDLKNFRQLGSNTPGHPELGDTHGVEATTGPLGAGLASAVGMAMAQEHLASKYNKEGYDLFDNYTYVLSGDGCMMEGITSEASSLAGTLKLGRLIVLYDSNNITIEGSTDIAFSENVRERYEAYGFDTYLVEDGNDLVALNEAITKAKSNLDRPSFIEVKTRIGFGTPVEGSNAAHGAPIGVEGIETLKNNLDFPSQDSFFVPNEVKDHYSELIQKGNESLKQWNTMLEKYSVEYPQLYEQFMKDQRSISIEELLANESLVEFDSKDDSTRNLSGIMINRLKDLYPNLMGGSADLASSTMTLMKNEESFSANNYSGRNLHFGVREHAMAAIGNGLTMYGGLKAYVATFFVFSDFLKPMARLSALSKLPLTYVLTHDSIGVGEDGPTHQPVEQLTMFRSMPNFITYRPADAKETAYGWISALSSETQPHGLILSRQNLPQLEGTGEGALKGGYVVADAENFDSIIIATGSEVHVAVEAAKVLNTSGKKVRVVSMPSIELFELQSSEYRESILPINIEDRLVVEAGSSMSWGKYIGLKGQYLCIDTFGQSGPGNALFQEYKITKEHIIELMK